MSLPSSRGSVHLGSLLGLGILAFAAGCEVPDPGGEAPQAPLPTLDPELLDAMNEELVTQHELHQAPGITAAISLPGVQTWVGSIGLADLDEMIPMEASDRFKIASVTKTFVAAAVLRLVDDGTLELNSRLGDVIDVHPRGDDITLRQLLNHTAGVPSFSTSAAFQQGGLREYTDLELAQLVEDEPLLLEPGSGFFYSNTHYLYLGMVITEVVGRPWQSEVASLAAERGLNATRVPAEGEDWENIVRGYIGTWDRTGSILPSMMSASGNMASNAADLSLWASAFWGGELFSAEVSEMITEDPVSVSGFDFGLSTMIRQWRDETILYHNGSLNGYVSWAGFRPSDQLSVSVLANAWVGPPGQEDFQYQEQIAAALFDAFDAAAP